MQTFTFRCSTCNRRMGVGLELIGKQARCPHCRQVILVPSPSEPPPITKATVTPSATDPSPPSLSNKPLELPDFRTGVNESVESIFAETTEPDHGLFSGDPAPQKPLFENLPHEAGLPIKSKNSTSNIDFDMPGPRGSSDEQATMRISRSKELGTGSHENFEPPPESLLPTTVNPTASDAIVDSPFPVPESRASWDSLARDAEKRSATHNRAAATSSTPPSVWLILLISYAVVMTLLAAWGWLRPR